MSPPLSNTSLVLWIRHCNKGINIVFKQAGISVNLYLYLQVNDFIYLFLKLVALRPRLNHSLSKEIKHRALSRGVLKNQVQMLRSVENAENSCLGNFILEKGERSYDKFSGVSLIIQQWNFAKNWVL